MQVIDIEKIANYCYVRWGIPMSYYIENKKYQYFIGNMPGLGGVPHIHSHLEMV